jgi:hypothetical protein
MREKCITYFLTVCSIILPQVILAQSNYVNHISSNKIEMVVNKADGSVIAIDVDEIDQIFFREKEDNDTIERESLPDYLLEEYQKTIDEARQAAGENGIIILYANDLHISYPGSGYYEQKLIPPVTHTLQAMLNMEKDLSPNFVLLGGDYIQLPLVSQGQTKEMGFLTLDYVNSWMNRFNTSRFMLIGNHELNYTGNNTGYGMTVDEFYEYCQQRYVNNAMVIEVGNSHQVFYTDDVSSNIRYLFLSTPTVDYSQLEEDIMSVLTSMPDNFSLIIANHFTGNDYAGNESELYYSVKQVLDMVKQSGVDFIIWIGAHNHADMTYIYDDMVAISCLQTGFWTSGVSGDGVKYEHKEETDTESAMTIIVVRKDLGKVYLKRFGLGRNREINYNRNSGEIGETIWSE